MFLSNSEIFDLKVLLMGTQGLNTLRPRQSGRPFADDTFKPIFLNENVRISIEILLKFVPKGPINNIPALVQIMTWRRSGDKPLSEPMTVSLLTHIYASLGLNELNMPMASLDAVVLLSSSSGQISNDKHSQPLEVQPQPEHTFCGKHLWWHFMNDEDWLLTTGMAEHGTKNRALVS